MARLRSRGKMPIRERIANVLDPDSPFLEISPLAGYNSDYVIGGGMVVGIGVIAGVECVIMGNDSSVLGGALDAATRRRSGSARSRCARENRIPYVSFVESAGADLRVETDGDGNRRRVQTDHFAESGRPFYEMIELSKLGIPTVCVVFGSSTAGGAYQPGLSDYVIVVKEQSKIFLAGPPLVKMATGEESDDESLGGARDARRGVGSRRLLRRGRDGRHPDLPRSGVAPQLAQARPAGVAARRRAVARPRGAARPRQPRSAPAHRHARRPRPGRRRLPVRGVQAGLRVDARVRVGVDPRLPDRRARATTASSTRTRRRRPPTSSSSATRSTCPCCSSRTSPATWSVVTSRPTASSRRARRC